jgi:MYXO-CTERM domain-containing protein
MVRKSVQRILAGGMAAATLVAAAPAAAKCGHDGVPCPDPVRLRISIDGSGLPAPIVIRGKDAWSMLSVTGVNNPYHAFDPVPAELGPRFEAVYRFRQGNKEWLVHQDVYPYAAGRPFAFTPPGQRFVDRDVEVDLSGDFSFPVVEAGDGWRGSRTLEAILLDHGLSASSLAGTRSAAGVAAFPRNQDGGGPPAWTLFAAAVGLLAVGGLAAIRGFRRRSARAHL